MVTITHDHTARRRSYELIAEAFGLGQPAGARGMTAADHAADTLAPALRGHARAADRGRRLVRGHADAGRPALPFFQREFDTTASWATWIATGFLLSSSVLTPILGKLGDSYGKKRMLVISLGIFGLASLGAAAAWSLDVADLLPRHPGRRARRCSRSAFGIIRDEFPPEKIGVGDRHGQLGVRRRRRGRAGAQRRDHRAPHLALAVPDRRDPGAGLDRAARHVRARVAGQVPHEAGLPRRPHAVARARVAADRDQRRHELGLDVGRRARPARRAPRCSRCGSRSSSACPSRSSTCARSPAARWRPPTSPRW